MRQRRLMNQINVVPYIDVMLVLLVIFMVTAPMIQSGSVNLPSVDKVPAPPTDAMIVQVKPNGDLTLRATSQSPDRPLSRRDLIGEVQDAVSANPGQSVIIAADKSVKYEQVMNTLNDLRNAGVNKVGLQTQIGKSAR
ncbi:MAG: protein TolR [Zoogloea sp.]|jgi:biopolymer transport protein TolR|uniref:protein TolR n=1 Tax=Zoogloea sp. TaxID=49181 RepID=UPI001B692D0B|nr:protein TolR [Zoogloea sp.]MBP8266939.1 protein TolR [Zoogloea sp.]HQA09202.1 protein TolR [Zoogloea sp.]HQE41306.1 protein TolR [Zoogloea sp.]